MTLSLVALDAATQAEHRARCHIGEHGIVLGPHALLRERDLFLTQKISGNLPQQGHDPLVIDYGIPARLYREIKVTAQGPRCGKRTLHLGMDLLLHGIALVAYGSR